MDPMISVIMTVFNEDISLIKQSLNSILLQSYVNKEIIVVLDNPGHKKAIDFLNSYENEIIFLINATNLGLPASLNRGIRASHGEIIARMDADDISLPNRLEDELKYMIQNKYDLVSSDFFLIDEDGNEMISMNIPPTTEGEISERIKYGNCMAHPTFMFSRKLFDTLGGYKEELIAAQDYEFIYHSISEGYKIGCIGKKLLKYRVRRDSISSKKQSTQLFVVDYIQRVYREGKEYSREYMHSCLIDNNSSDFHYFCKTIESYRDCIMNKIGVKKRIVQFAFALRYGCIRRLLFNHYIVTRRIIVPTYGSFTAK